MKQYPPLILWIALLLVFGSSVSHAQHVGSTAPAFRLADVQGQPLALTDVLGEPLVLNIWATWCPPCREELPLFEQAQAALAEDVTFLLVNNNENADVAAQFLAQEAISLLAAFEPTRAQRNTLDLDTTRDVVRDYRVRGMPTTFFIDAEGVIQAVRVGAVSHSELTELLTTIGVTGSLEALGSLDATTITDTVTEGVTDDATNDMVVDVGVDDVGVDDVGVDDVGAVSTMSIQLETTQLETTLLGELHGRISSRDSRFGQLGCGQHCPVDDVEDNVNNREEQP